MSDQITPKEETQFYDNSNVDVNNFDSNNGNNQNNTNNTLPTDNNNNTSMANETSQEEENHTENGNGNGNGNNQCDNNSQDSNQCDENGDPITSKPRDSNNMEPEQFRKVFIGGLSYKTDDDTLKEYFEKYGDLVDHVVMKDGQTGRSRGFGFVTYSESFMVDELMKNRPHIIDGRQVEPKRATPREDSGKSEVQMTVKKLFIGGLRDNISDDDLKAYFGVYGSVADAIVMKEKETGKSRGFGFVTFDDYDPVDKIILQKVHTINGVNVHTQKALPKDGSQEGGGRQGGSGYQGGSGGRGGRGSRQNYGNDGGGYQGNNGSYQGQGYQGQGYRGGNSMGMGGNGNENGMPRFGGNEGFNGSNSSMNNTYGSYNQAPGQAKMNSGMPMMGGQGGGYMGGSPGGNRGGAGPMRRGNGNFSNRSAGPYGGGGSGFQGGSRGGFQGNSGSGDRGGFRGGSGRGMRGGSMGNRGGGFNRGNGNQQQQQ